MIKVDRPAGEVYYSHRFTDETLCGPFTVDVQDNQVYLTNTSGCRVKAPTNVTYWKEA